MTSSVFANRVLANRYKDRACAKFLTKANGVIAEEEGIESRIKCGKDP